MMTNQYTYLSVIVPLYNEEANVPLFHNALSKILHQSEQDVSYEVIYVDDGSRDATFRQLEYLVIADPHVQVVRLRRNFGQTAAMAAGVAQSSGDVLVFMDGDLQNDPVDIPRLLAKLEEGYDVVSGWRKHRKDARFSRKLPSQVANRLIARVTGVHLHDYGCTLKAYRRDMFQQLRLYGEMHRFLPAYASLIGARIAELEVVHHPRRFGASKYGISRTVRVILDLITLKFFARYSTKPMHAFGLPGLTGLGLGTGVGTTWLVQRFFVRRTEARNFPLFILALLLSGFGLQCILLGLLAELLMRTYHESQNKPVYTVRTVLSAQDTDVEDLFAGRSDMVEQRGRVVVADARHVW